MSIDVHTHIYLPRYAELLRGRKDLPFVRDVEGVSKLYILPGEEQAGGAGGRPFGPDYVEIKNKIKAMDENDIAVSVLSSANPWLDFLEAGESEECAKVMNDDLSEICLQSNNRIYGFAMLPLKNVRASVAELDRLSANKSIKGVIIGTLAAGKGLDDPALHPIWEKIQALGYMVFVHPHYGIGSEHMQGFGHSLPLALGFPFETSTAISKLVLSGVLEKFPDLRLLLAHSGGTLPFLAGRLDHCVKKDHVLAGKLPQKPSQYLSKLYYDALSYETRSIAATIDLCGPDHLMFGTDFPFFGHDTVQIYSAINNLSPDVQAKIKNQNAIRLLDIQL